ncbi:putative ATP-dependent RNA helicase DHX33 [Hypsibius exemplaris]|uniref:RNA helicase n=1 Tax=Hypsibius exemplaris TaxID=2072580 RepID=A0A1W0WV05_HYPEX|nr:putative ATP-dependent RNA helicase DHX33 [Hypsibius exemplaris]
MMSPGMVFPAKRTTAQANTPDAETPANNRTTAQQLLPVQQYASEVAEFLRTHKSASVVIIVSDTGSGKTTQIPQILTDKIFDDYFGGPKRKIAVTQPRRVAAVSVATRVAQEFGCKLGEEVGYSVRFDDMSNPQTKIKYMTDGMLVREAQTAWMLEEYNMIILDEVHERSLHTDVLLALTKKASVRRRKFFDRQDKEACAPLKILLMSATMDIERMRTFWKDAPVLYIPGKTFPVTIKYMPAPVDDYTHTAMVAVFQIHREEDPGDILVFLTGQEEIEEMVRRCRQVAKSLPPQQANIQFVPLYAGLTNEAQMRAVSQTAASAHNGHATMRKVIISTNVAETSITIPGVKYVIDSGRAKHKVFTSATGMEVLKVEKISQAQAWQRTGRAGREQAGVCYRLYTEADFNCWPQHPIPEILRCNLSTVLLQVVEMGIEKPLAFPFFDRPEEENLQAAVDQLEWLGALTQKVESGDLVVETTADGKLMAQFPVDPKYARCILRARAHRCTEELLTIVAMLSSDSPFINPAASRTAAAAAHEKFSSNEGDHVVLLNVWRAFRDQKKGNVKASRAWASQNYINLRNLERAEKVRNQLREVCVRKKIDLSSCGGNTTAVRRSLSEGLFMSAAERLPDGSYITVDTRQTVFLHPASCLFKTKPACVVYGTLIRTAKLYVRELCLVEADWIDAVGKEYFLAMRQRMAEKLAGKTTSAAVVAEKGETSDAMEVDGKNADSVI